ncbi:MAG: T9SS C-terminal target domain-containing protein [Winogradskyella sp.]|uniref:T9SS type A sorting domain-containing protein n=1 Tax=Winogradskyella sp. TaxID=1883156 RepID=UPI000F3D1C6C|nr:T9SS type A sorting domain-containing protein [Winogradskyella sp.]RNC80176.1 MAG: T9SS C-terminal target domain-containing protein [Winogradskyella sp.]
MKHFYFTLLFLSSSLFMFSQEVLSFNGYNGSGATVTAVTASVNDNITITFEDIDIINNLYTENQNSLFIYGGLDTSAGGFQGAPGFGDLGSQPEIFLDAGDTDSSTGPNTYSITINLALEYTSVLDGTEVFGYNLIFQNQFGGGGNNQTVDLYIDLIDKIIDRSTLNTNSVQIDAVETRVVNNSLIVNSNSSIQQIQIYSILGEKILDKTYNNNTYTEISTDYMAKGIYVVKVYSGNKISSKKVIL